MSETAPETTTATEVVTSETTETTAPATPEQPKPTETVDHWKQMAKLQEKRAKENADKAKEFDAFQESQKSEQQKIADRAAAAERERDDARAEGLRYKAAAKFSVDEDHFDLLGSGDEETILARAERVGGLIAAKAENDQLKAELEALRAGKPAPSRERPLESLRPGATPGEAVTADDALYASIYGHGAP